MYRNETYRWFKPIGFEMYRNETYRWFKPIGYKTYRKTLKILDYKMSNYINPAWTAHQS
jgi:hypothetical protein